MLTTICLMFHADENDGHTSFTADVGGCFPAVTPVNISKSERIMGIRRQTWLERGEAVQYKLWTDFHDSYKHHR